MDSLHFFDALAYFQQMASTNKLAAANGFYPCVCSGIASLEGVMEMFRKKNAFLCVDDTNDMATNRISGGYFGKRTITVFLLMRYKMDDMADRAEKLDICRQLYRQILTKLLVDKERNNDLAYLNENRFFSREIGQYFMAGCTGLYFMIEIDEPISLCYDGKEWQE